MALDDYGALLRSGAAAVPDYAAQEAQKQMLALREQGLRQQMAAAQRQIDQEESFQTDLAGVLTNPTAEGYARVIAKHPEFAQEAKASWDVLDKKRQQADLQSMSEVYASAANGRYDVAAALMKRRIEADKAAGQEIDPADQAIVDALESGDPTQQKAALGMVGVTLSAVTGPEKFEATLGALTKKNERNLNETGGVVWDKNTGEVIGRVPGSEIKIIPGVGIERIDIEGVPLLRTGTSVVAPAEGGGPASGPVSAAGPINLPPAESAVASTLATALPSAVVAGFLGNFEVEGGYGGARGDGGSAQGIAQWRGERASNFRRVIGKPVAEASPDEQARFVLWEMNNPEAAGMTTAQRDEIMSAKTPEQAAVLIDRHYERSSGEHRGRRVEAAKRYGSVGIGGVTRVRSLQEARSLPPGTVFLTPDGRRKVR